MVKSAVRIQEPLAWRGGRLACIWKGKADPSECSSSRGVLVSDIVGKSYHRIVRKHLVPYIDAYASDSQCGGLAGRATDIACLAARAFLDGNKHRGWSAAIIFLDVVSAFDSALRQLLVPVLHPLSIADTVDFSSFKGLEKQLLSEILLQPSALAQAGVPPHLAAIAADIHEATWFAVAGAPGIVSTICGSKPGDPLGDLMYNFLMARVIKNLRDELHTAGLVVSKKFDRETPAFAEPVNPSENIESMDVSYVDDEAIFIEDSDAMELIGKIQAVTMTAIRTFASHGLQLNFGPGKSECLASLRGKNSKIAKLQVYIQQQSTIPIVDEIGSIVSYIRVIHSYKHLGGIINSHSSMSAEVRQRASSAWGDISVLLRKFFRNSDIPCQKRVTVLMMITLSKLLYNSGTWGPLSKVDLQALQRVVVRVLRMIFGLEYIPGVKHCNDDAVLRAAGIPPMEWMLRRSRLAMLARLVRSRSTGLLALIQNSASCKTSWASLVRDDLAVIWRLSPKFDLMPCPDLTPSVWAALASCFGPQWLSLVRLVCCSVRPSVSSCEEGEEGNASLHSVHICPECGTIFLSGSRLATHRWSSHRVRSQVRFYAYGTCCKACHIEFHSRKRLIHHLSFASKKCFYHLVLVDTPLSEEHCDVLDIQDALLSSKLRRAGRTPTFVDLPAYRSGCVDVVALSTQV